MPRPLERHIRFAEYLNGFAQRDNRAVLAALRRGLGDERGGAAETYRYVVPWLPSNAGRDTEDAYYLIAGLFALHPLNWTSNADNPRRSNFGASFARLKSDESDSLERRFVALLNAHEDDFHVHLRHAVSLLRANDVAVDWAQLLNDVERWDHPDRYVQRDWARSFWAPTRQDADPETTPAAVAGES